MEIHRQETDEDTGIRVNNRLFFLVNPHPNTLKNEEVVRAPRKRNGRRHTLEIKCKASLKPEPNPTYI